MWVVLSVSCWEINEVLGSDHLVFCVWLAIAMLHGAIELLTKNCRLEKSIHTPSGTNHDLL